MKTMDDAMILYGFFPLLLHRLLLTFLLIPMRFTKCSSHDERKNECGIGVNFYTFTINLDLAP
jgi:hypothetical protein